MSHIGESPIVRISPKADPLADKLMERCAASAFLTDTRVSNSNCEQRT